MVAGGGEEEWTSLSLEETTQLAGELLLLLQEIERSEERDPKRLSMQEMLSRLKGMLDELGASYEIIGAWRWPSSGFPARLW
ncbi:MAG: hypothetical protein U9R11_01880, partial [Chloroflexota bacterium]|nr:hypothetical protein [Chloroflexota bacterium]